jgi:hypothetical protein
LILGWPFEANVIETTQRLLGLQQAIGVAPPIVALVSLLRVRGWGIRGENTRDELLHYRQKLTIDRDTLMLPEVLFESFDDNVGSRFQPAFDAFWQAGGRKASPNYDEEGDWQSR